MLIASQQEIHLYYVQLLKFVYSVHQDNKVMMETHVFSTCDRVTIFESDFIGGRDTSLSE